MTNMLFWGTATTQRFRRVPLKKYLKIHLNSPAASVCQKVVNEQTAGDSVKRGTVLGGIVSHARSPSVGGNGNCGLRVDKVH